MSKKCVHYHVTGRVQGVWFRAHTQKMAQGLNLQGWVRNLPDGSVELIACGEEENIHQLETWLWEGPTLARVDNLTAEIIDWQVFEDFVVR
jgi:acylphosphatase